MNSRQGALSHAESFLLSLPLLPNTPHPQDSIQTPGIPSWGGKSGGGGRDTERARKDLKAHSKLEIEMLPHLGKKQPTREGWGSKV